MRAHTVTTLLLYPEAPTARDDRASSDVSSTSAPPAALAGTSSLRGNVPATTIDEKAVVLAGSERGRCVSVYSARARTRLRQITLTSPVCACAEWLAVVAVNVCAHAGTKVRVLAGLVARV
jgi:hypothetical protein